LGFGVLIISFSLPQPFVDSRVSLQRPHSWFFHATPCRFAPVFPLLFFFQTQKASFCLPHFSLLLFFPVPFSLGAGPFDAVNLFPRTLLLSEGPHPPPTRLVSPGRLFHFRLPRLRARRLSRPTPILEIAVLFLLFLYYGLHS